MFLLLISNRTINHLVHGLAHHQSITAAKGDERIGASFDITNQFGIEHEWFAVESGELDHGRTAFQSGTSEVGVVSSPQR